MTWLPFKSLISVTTEDRRAATTTSTSLADVTVSTIFCTARVPCMLRAMATRSLAALEMMATLCSSWQCSMSFCIR